MKYYIYCYTNKITNRKYVGQTNDLNRRKREHRSNSFSKNSAEYNLLFHKKMREYGEENFIFSVLEEIETDNISIVNEREKYWIAEMKSYVEDNGYNLTLGGENNEHARIYDEETIKEIKEKIKQGVSYSDISFQYQISIGYISGINNGNFFKDENETYPLKKFYQSQEELSKVIDLLENSILNLKEIVEALGLGYSTVKKINSGALHYDKNKNYPIRKLNTTQMKAKVVQEMLMQGKSNNEIILRTKVSQNTINRINRGETHYNQLLQYPLRKPVSTIAGQAASRDAIGTHSETDIDL